MTQAVAKVTRDQAKTLTVMRRVRLTRSARKPAKGLTSAYTIKKAVVSRPNCASVIGMNRIGFCTSV